MKRAEPLPRGGLPDVHREWPLSGRDGELALLGSLLARPDAAGAVLVGSPGVGTTRLAVAGLGLAEQAGLPTARLSATPAAAGLSYGALQSLVTGPDRESDPAAYRAELLRRAAGALAARARDGRLVLHIDNAHHLDDESAALLRHLVAAGVAVLLLTVAAGEPAPESVRGLWRDGLLERLDVTPLDGSAVADLLASVLGGPVDPSAVARLAARSRGNLLYLRELVLSAVGGGALAEQGGLWRLTAAPGVPPRLVDLVEARLGLVTSAQRALLEAVALGEPLGQAELDALAGFDVAEDLEAAGLLRTRDDGRRLEVRLAHPLYGEVLRAGISPARRREVFGTLADALAATGARRSGDAVRIATGRMESGTGDPRTLLGGAYAAWRRHNLATAERLARAAAEAGAGFDARLAAIQLAGQQGRLADAEAELATLSPADDGERARHTGVLVETLRLSGRLHEALAVVLATAPQLAAGPARDEIDALHARLLLDVEGPVAALPAANAVRAATRDGARAWACLVAGIAQSRTGALAEAVRATEEGRAAHAGAVPSPAWPVAVLDLARAGALQAAGRLAEAADYAERVHAGGVAAGAIAVQAMGAWVLSAVAISQGRMETAVRYGWEATALLRSLGGGAMLRDGLACLARAEAHCGHADAAAASLAELDEIPLPPNPWIHAEVLGARAWTQVARGDVPGALALLEEAATWAGEHGDRLALVATLHDLARLGRARDVQDRLAHAAASFEGELALARVAHVAALVDGDAPGLLKAAESFAAMQAWLLAAEAAADAAGAARLAGDPAAAAAAHNTAQDYAGRCEGARTPALAVSATPAVLTPAERAAALLAAQGLSNREIAVELSLSVRTIENRLQRAYEKLGVSARAQLTEVLS